MDAKQWPAMKAKMTEVFKAKTRDEWCAIMEGTDVCFAPVLSLSEAPNHPHMAERKIFVDVDGISAARAGAALFTHAVCDQEDGGGGAWRGVRRSGRANR